MKAAPVEAVPSLLYWGVLLVAVVNFSPMWLKSLRVINGGKVFCKGASLMIEDFLKDGKKFDI